MQRAEVRVIREALEAVLSPSLTSSVLFEALEQAGGGIPQSNDDLRALVHGTLARVLEKRLGPDQAERILAEIQDRLLDDGASGMQLRPDAGEERTPGARGRADEATTTIPTAREPVAVAVVAATKSFAARLSAALGPSRVAPVAVRSVAELRALGQPPSIVLLDATDFAAIEPGELAGALGELPATTLRTVWASDLPYGRTALAALERAGVPTTALDRREGIDPLLDLIRARHRA